MAFPLIFLGTDDFSLKCLNSLIKYSTQINHPKVKAKQSLPLAKSLKPIFEVRGVITQPVRRKGRGWHQLPSPVQKKAQELSLPVLTPVNLKDPDFLSQVKALKAKWAILLSYGKILPLHFLSLFPQRALNFHASLLPRWRGAAPVQRAIMAGDKTMGLSLQVMHSGLDKGPVIGARAFTLTTDMSAISVFDKMALLLEELLTQDMLSYMQGQKVPQPQEESQATWAPKIEKKESQLIWSQPALTLFNQIRALVKGPQAWTLYKGKRIKIYKSFVPNKKIGNNKYQISIKPGQVVEVQKNGFTVACGKKSFLSIVTMQPESKKIISAGDYIRGYGLKKGDCFE